MEPTTEPTPVSAPLPADPAVEAKLANKFGELVVSLIMLDEIFDHISENQ